jgi:hypothetical protein
MNGMKVMSFMVILKKSFVIFSVVIIHFRVNIEETRNVKVVVLFVEFYASADQDKNLGFGGLDGRGRKKQDAPIDRDLLLALEDCYHGAIKKIKISRRVRSEDFYSCPSSE